VFLLFLVTESSAPLPVGSGLVEDGLTGNISPRRIMTGYINKKINSKKEV